MKKLNIAITADPELPVPPSLYGGIERIIDMLIKGYIQRGHRVSLFAHSDSITEAKLYPYKGKKSNDKVSLIKNAWLINKTLLRGDFDIVHSFGRLIYLLPQLPLQLPKLMSYQREPTLTQIRKAVKLSKKHTLAFTGCSNYISHKISPYAPAYTVYNGVDLNTYQFQQSVSNDAPLIFLGRVEPIKGAHIAIEVARKTKRKLIIAGNIPLEYQDYFNQQIQPYLNEQIQYVGPVNNSQKNELLGKAHAFLMPILWNEPFGIVMAEAMACGTPVIGLAYGAIPEVIVDKLNGFKCSTVDEMVKAIEKVNQLDRLAVRLDCEKRFSMDIIVNAYLDIYQKLLSGHA